LQNSEIVASSPVRTAVWRSLRHVLHYSLIIPITVRINDK